MSNYILSSYKDKSDNKKSKARKTASAMINDPEFFTLVMKELGSGMQEFRKKAKEDHDSELRQALTCAMGAFTGKTKKSIVDRLEYGLIHILKKTVFKDGLPEHCCESDKNFYEMFIVENGDNDVES